MQIAVSLAGGAAGAQYAMSDNPFDIDYTAAGEVTYSETNHKALFGNSVSLTSVARLLTGYGISGQSRAIEFESVVKAAAPQIVGLRPSLTQGTTATSLGNGANDVSYRSTGVIKVNNVQIATGLATWGANDKIAIIYNVTPGTVEFLLNGVSIYTVTGVSGDMTPACEGESGNTHEMRVSTSSSYALTGGALYWR